MSSKLYNTQQTKSKIIGGSKPYNKNTVRKPRKSDGIYIHISKKIQKRTATFGIKGSSWDTILNDLLEHCNSCDRFWENRFP